MAETSPSSPSSPEVESSPASAGAWGNPDAVAPAEGDPIDTITIVGTEGTEVATALDAVEYSEGPDGATVAALAFTLTPTGEVPTHFGSPIEGTDWVYATSPDGSDAQSFFQMTSDYSENWVGRDVDTWNSGPYAPGTTYQVLATIPIESPGGYIAYVTGEGHMVGPIELPAEDTGLPNAQIGRAHEIVNDLGSSGMLLSSW
ncbi:hypothetical protein AB0K08_13470 [Citricoccus sp. NPDC055426]|uniref:hypothetical protein n=1 Tax=Citricoccus sp. NPDC055426 TaxID=3155536 RepID=UPI0034239E5B